MKIAGSFLKINNDKDKIDKLNDVVDILHFDIMDGIFTEKSTPSIDSFEKYLKDVNKPIDIHLMVVDVKKYVDEVIKFKPNNITFHIELSDIVEKINYVKNTGTKVGIAINPNTDLDLIYEHLHNIDLVLIMSVYPGGGGRTFIDISDKLKKLYDYRCKNNLSFDIEVDGGINDITVNKVLKADIIVSGSYITDSDNYYEKVMILRSKFNQ